MEGKIQGQVMGQGKVSAENWRVKEFKRREQKKKTRKKRLSYKTNSRSPASVSLSVHVYIYGSLRTGPTWVRLAQLGYAKLVPPGGTSKKTCATRWHTFPGRVNGPNTAGPWV